MSAKAGVKTLTQMSLRPRPVLLVTEPVTVPPGSSAASIPGSVFPWIRLRTAAPGSLAWPS